MKSQTIIITDRESCERVLNHINALSLDKPWEITVGPYRIERKRSLNQNSLYHIWVGFIANHTGHSHDEIHEICKKKFLAPEIKQMFGETYGFRSTRKLSVDHMATYMDRVNAWAGTDLGLMLPVKEG